MSNTTNQRVWTLVCDEDVKEMSAALGRPYSLGEFIGARLAVVSTRRISAVHTDQRIDSRSDPEGFAAQFELLSTHLCREIFTSIAKLAADVGKPIDPPSAAQCNIATIMKLGADVMRHIESLFEAGSDHVKRISSEAFRRTLADLSLVLADNFNERSVFANATQAIPTARMPDDAWIAQARKQKYVLVPVSFEHNGEQSST